MPRFHCPYCDSSIPPYEYTRTRFTAWWLMVLMFSTCILIPFCWLPLVLMRDHYHRCRTCGLYLDTRPSV